MTGELRRNNINSIKKVHLNKRKIEKGEYLPEGYTEGEECNCSPYTMAAVVGCLLFCVGIIIYALIGG